MGRIILFSMAVGLTAGCSAQVSERADTSAEVAPGAMELSPAAVLGRPGQLGGTPPGAAAVAGDAPAAETGAGDKPAEKGK